MNIKDLIRTQSSLMDTSDYDFNLPVDFNTVDFNTVSEDVCSEASSSKRNGAKYIAKPYTVCGEVNKGFYSHYIPFKKDLRAKP